MGIVYDDCCRHTCSSMTVSTVRGRTMSSRSRMERLFSLVRSLSLYLALGKYMFLHFHYHMETVLAFLMGQ